MTTTASKIQPYKIDMVPYWQSLLRSLDDGTIQLNDNVDIKAPGLNGAVSIDYAIEDKGPFIYPRSIYRVPATQTGLRSVGRHVLLHAEVKMDDFKLDHRFDSIGITLDPLLMRGVVYRADSCGATASEINEHGILGEISEYSGCSPDKITNGKMYKFIQTHDAFEPDTSDRLGISSELISDSFSAGTYALNTFLAQKGIQGIKFDQ